MASKSELPYCRSVYPTVPTNAKDFKVLRSNLEGMGLDFLLSLPWGVQCSSLVADLESRELSEATRATIRA